MESLSETLLSHVESDFLTAVKTTENYTREEALRAWNGINDIFFYLYQTFLFYTRHREIINIKFLSDMKAQSQNNYKNIAIPAPLPQKISFGK